MTNETPAVVEQSHQLEDAGAPPMPDWIEPAFATYTRLDRRLKVLRPAKAAVFSSLGAFSLYLLFMTSKRPTHQAFWIEITLIIIVISAALVPFAYGLTRRTDFDRKRVLQKFFKAGFRIDPNGQVITNEAHFRIVLSAADRLNGASLKPKRDLASQPAE